MAEEERKVVSYSEAGGQLRFAADQLRIDGQAFYFDRDQAKMRDGAIGLQSIDQLAVSKKDGVTIITGSLTKFSGTQASYGMQTESFTVPFRVELGQLWRRETVDVWGKSRGEKKFRSMPNKAAAELMGNITNILRWMKTHPTR